MVPMKIAIADDELYVCQQIRECLLQYSTQKNVDMDAPDIYTDCRTLYNTDLSGKRYDVVFMDIDFSGENNIARLFSDSYAVRERCSDGLALGKGVLICENEQQAADGVKEIMLDKKFGASGNHVVVEEFLTGPEVSVLSFTDGKVVKPMVSSMDHKRANDHDTGLNTGGMGTIAPNPYYTPEVAAECMEKIFLPTIKAMNTEGCPFKGCLYFGLMLTPDGPKVIEYNCRFGDPETQVVLPLLESDLLKIMAACTEGTLADTEVKFSEGAACCVILASGGYPVSYEKGKPISGLTNGQLEGESSITVYHSGTALREDGTLVTNGGRVLGVTATAPRLTAAITQAYAAAEKISFEKLHKRTDIGMRALKAIAER